VALISNYHDHPAYIGALAESVRAHWEKNGQAEKLVMSFHGIPQQVVDQGDPYADQCKHTGKLLATELGLNENQWKLTFQSRFGPAKWLQPYTQPTLEAMGREGVVSVDVICPGFSSDCLETLEEVSLEVREAFLECGGKQFAYIPCLNDRPAHIAALTEILKPSL
jgi:ferrochelatase